MSDQDEPTNPGGDTQPQMPAVDPSDPANQAELFSALVGHMLSPLKRDVATLTRLVQGMAEDYFKVKAALEKQGLQLEVVESKLKLVERPVGGQQ